MWNMHAVCRCLLRLGFRVCSYDLVLLTSYACMQKLRSCRVLGCWCRCLLRLQFRGCSHGLILLSGYACTWKKLFLDVFWVDGVDVWFVYGHGFVHIVYVPKLDTANHLGELSEPLRHSTPETYLCVPKVHTANHLFESSEPLRHFTPQTNVCVSKVHTANHLFELSEPLSDFTPQTSLFVPKLHSEPLMWTERTTWWFHPSDKCVCS